MAYAVDLKGSEYFDIFYIDGFVTEQTSVYETSMSDPLTKLDLSANVANYS